MKNFRRKEDKTVKPQSIYQHITNNLHLIVLLLVVLFIIGMVKIVTPISYNQINNEKNAVFKEDWQYSVDDDVFKVVELPFSEEEPIKSRITLKNRTPKVPIKGETILLRTSQQNVEVFIDDVLIYSSYEKDGKPQSPSSAYHFIRLPIDVSDAEIKVVLTSPYERYLGLMNQIFIGSKASNIFYLVHTYGARFMIGFVIFGIGFLFMFGFLFAKRQKKIVGIVYLGAFFICAGFWVSAESRMLQFIFPYPMIITDVSIFALSLLPVFSGLYYYNTHIKRFRKLGKRIIMVMSVASILVGLATLINPMCPLEILPYYLILMGAYLFVFFISIIVDGVTNGRLFSASVCGVIAFGLCSAIELGFYLNNIKSHRDSFFLISGLLIFSVMMMIDLIQNFIKVYQESINATALKVLAYTDSLTGLGNRRDFLENLEIVSTTEKLFITIGMFDIDNLKEVNDTQGHLMGDMMIKHSARVLKNSLRVQDKVYRLGGDEFVSIILHDDSLDKKTLAKRLIDRLEKENKKSGNYVLNIAYGYATFKKTEDQDLFATLSRADERMYACKKKQKEKREQGKQ